METVIFTPSITTNRGGRKLANKAGFSRLDRVILFLYSDLYLPFLCCYGQESRLERVVIDSGKGKSLSCLPTNVNHDHAHRNHYTSRTGHPLRQTRLGAPSPVCSPTAGAPTIGVRSGEYFSLRAPGVHLPGMQKNQFPGLREKVSNQQGEVFGGTQVGGQKSGNPVRACRKRAWRLHGLIC